MTVFGAGLTKLSKKYKSNLIDWQIALCSFIIPWQINQIEELELSVKFAFGIFSLKFPMWSSKLCQCQSKGGHQ